MSRPVPHGTMSGYKRHRCRCEPCTTAHTAYNRRRYVDSKIGRRRYLDAAPVRQHLQRLVAAGWTPMQLEVASGVNRTAIRNILGTRPGYGPARHVMPKTAQALLTVTGRPGAKPGAAVPRYRVARRLQALHALGWGLGTIADRLGITPQHVTRLIERDSPANGTTFAKINTLYRELHMIPGPSDRARRRAARLGWLPPLAWDDIDNPNETPASTRVRRVNADVVTEALFMWEGGASQHAIAASLGIDLGSVERAFYRAGRSVPWPVEKTRSAA